jgi:hypothetical protein
MVRLNPVGPLSLAGSAIPVAFQILGCYESRWTRGLTMCSTALRDAVE